MRGGERDARGFGGEVDLGAHAVELAELALDAAHAGRAGHAAHAHGERREGQLGVRAGQDDVRVGLRHGGDGIGGRHSAELRRDGRDDGGGARGLGLAYGIEKGSGHVDAQGGQPGRAADQHAALVGHADDAEPRLVRKGCDGHERQAAVRGARRDGAGDGMLGQGLDGGGEGQGRGLARAGRDRDRLEGHDARGDGARLVQEHRVDRARLLEDFGVLDEDAQLRGAPRPDEDRGGRGQAERARARHDQNGDGRRERGLHAAAREQPAPERQQGNDDDDRHEHAGDLVRESLDGRLTGLGLGDHAPHLRERRVRTDARGAHQQGPPRVDGRTRHRVAGGGVHGHGLARQERGVQGGGTLDDDAVGCHLLARAHRKEVTDLQG